MNFLSIYFKRVALPFASITVLAMKMRYGLSILATPVAISLLFAPLQRLRADDRELVRLSPQERDYFLAEMRQFLFSINGVMAGLAGDDPALAMESARESGTAFDSQNRTVQASLAKKLPPGFQTLHGAIHSDFDALSSSLEQKEDMQKVLSRITNITGKCVACHTKYRVSP